jgi:hypothetical protein
MLRCVSRPGATVHSRVQLANRFDHFVKAREPDLVSSPLNVPLWYSVAEPISGEEWTPRWTPQREVGGAQILGLGLVSVLVSIFRPDGVDLVDFRDFRDCTSSRVSDWESAK